MMVGRLRTFDVVLYYGYDLPRPSQERKRKPWCRDIVRKAKEEQGEGDALIDPVPTKILRMNQSTGDQQVIAWRNFFI